MVLAAQVWHYWIGVVLAIAAILTVVALVVGYLVKVERPAVPAATRTGRATRVATPVDWELAERLALRLSAREPFASSYHADSLAADFAELHRRGRGAGGARPPACGRWPARPAPAWSTGRTGSRPTSRRSSGSCARRSTGSASASRNGPSIPLTVTRKVPAAEVGALLGWMSGRVLGQYDLLVVDDEHRRDQDLVYYVGPNVLSTSRSASASRRASSASGSPSTRSPTGPSSPACRGCASTSSAWSSGP